MRDARIKATSRFQAASAVAAQALAVTAMVIIATVVFYVR
ncbi:MAG: hypothetical protein JWR89_3142 [Tardiphaga sp.]|jgi:hypothetical protein|nr:hypothetical protein [Tardiphaga sp.]